MSFSASGILGRRRFMSLLPLLPLAVVVVAIFLVPVTSLLSLSVLDPAGSLTAEHYAKAFASDVYINIILYTLRVSLVVTVISLIVAYPVCIYLASLDLARRRTALLWILIPFWTSFLIRTFAWIIILGRKGLINDYLLKVGLVSDPLELIYNSIGLGVGFVHALLPLAILTMLPVILGIDPNLSRASAVLGAGRAQTFWRVYVPLSFPGIAAAGVLVYVTAIGFFITPALLGGSAQTMISQVIIRQVQELLNWSLAGALSVMLLFATVVVLAIYNQFFGLASLLGAGERRSASKVKTGGKTPLQVKVLGAIGELCEFVAKKTGTANALSKRGNVLIRAFSWLVLVLLMFPSLALVPISVSEAALLSWPRVGLSWRWYYQLWNSGEWMASLTSSFVIGLAVGLLSVAIGTAAAFVIVRVRFPGKAALLALAVAPLIIPRIIIGVALMYFLAKFALVDTYAGLILGHLVIAIPYVLITVIAVLRDYNISLDHAAWTLGASSGTAFRKITLPLIKPALITSLVFAFITSFDDVTIAMFLSGSNVITLPKRMWLDAFLDVTPVLAAVSTLLIGVIFTLLLGTELLRARETRRLKHP